MTGKRSNNEAERRALGRARADGPASFPIPPPQAELASSYARALSDIRERIEEARLRAVLNANAALVALYWDVGREILARQDELGWGAKVVDRLSADLRTAFPEMSGFSSRNISYMRAFSAAWPDEEFVQRVLQRLPWGVNLVLLDAVAAPAERRWYAERAVRDGWSRTAARAQIERGLFEREGKAVSNFALTLPPRDSDVATQIFKDPYLFDFLGTADPRREAEVERALVAHVERFLLELGAGFAFVGRQVALEVGDQDFKLDLLFYHFKLHCFVVVELKVVPFEPAFAGQLNFYLSAVDDLLKQPEDKPTIGLLLCRTKNRVVVEYALRDVQKPMGVANWEPVITAALPEALRGALPSVEEIEAEFGASEASGER